MRPHQGNILTGDMALKLGQPTQRWVETVTATEKSTNTIVKY